MWRESVRCASLRMLLSAFCVLWALPAVAQTPSPESLIHTTGPSFQCLNFLALEQLQAPGRNEAAVLPGQLDRTLDYYQVLGWVKGFLSASNFYGVRGQYRIGANMESHQFMSWMFSYCRAHPNDHVVQGADALSRALGNGSKR
jgi:hypothetical protein